MGHVHIGTVTAVVTNHNGGHGVLECIQSLLSQSFVLNGVIVVDNGSTDGSAQKIRECFREIQVIELNENRGPSVARNVGLWRAQTDLVLFIDDDVQLEFDCIEKLVNAFNNQQATVVCPRICLLPDQKIVQADGAASHFLGTMILRHSYQSIVGLHTEMSPVDGCISACLLCKRQTMIEAGGFNELYFFQFEDLEVSIRLRALGHRFICEPLAVAYHDRGEGTKGLSFRGKGIYPARRAYLTMRNRLLTILIHYRIRTIILLFPALTVYEIAVLILVCTKGWLRLWISGWFWLIQNWKSIYRYRRWIQRRRVLNDNQLLTGGPIPIAPGFLGSEKAALATTYLSAFLNAYWQLARFATG